MRIVSAHTIEGRNVWSAYPVAVLEIDLEDMTGVLTSDLPGFTERLVGAIPGLARHHCAAREPGGFLRRLADGTLAGHVVEHVALELQVMAGMPHVLYGQTRAVGTGRYRVVYEIEHGVPGLRAGQLAVALVDELAHGGEPDVAGPVAELVDLARRALLGPSTQSIVKAAQARGMPVMRLGERSLIQIGYGFRRRLLAATITDATGCLACDLVSDKKLTKDFLAQAGIPVPEGAIAHSEPEAVDAAWRLGFPVVVKPVDGNQGKGVSLDLRSPAQVAAAAKLAMLYSHDILVEKFVPGRHYRITVVNGRAVAAAERLPAAVTGDGVHTVRELVEIENCNPLRGVEHEKPLTRIVIDPVVLLTLSKQGRSPDDVPAAGETVVLRENANLSTGGTAKDVTDDMHSDNAAVAVRAVRVMGLDVAAVDLVTPDIALPMTATGGAVIEVNAAPGIRMHHFPSAGRPRDVAGAIVDYLFPDGRARIPLVAVTGTNGKTTVTRLVRHLLKQRGLTVGMTTTEGVWVGDEQIMHGDCAGPASARAVLRDDRVEAAVLETARGGIIRGGLAFDRCDVAVVTNLSGDHLGLDGIETLEELAKVKSVIVDAVGPGGFAVLNARDPLVREMALRCRGEVIFFANETPVSVQADYRDDPLAAHLARGGRAVVVQDGTAVLCHGNERTPVIEVGAIPLTLGGQARHQVENVLAAAAAGWALGFSAAELAAGLASFAPRDNPGRLEITETGGISIWVDYGHNPAAYQATLETARWLCAGRLLVVAGAPGDRQDENLRVLGRIAARYANVIVVKEDNDRRGRPPGETAALIAQGVREAGFPAANLEIVLPEDKATVRALDLARQGDLVVVFFEKRSLVLEAIANWAAGQRAGTTTVQAERIVG